MTARTESDTRHPSGSELAFESARLQLARLHCSASLRDSLYQLARIAMDALNIERFGVWLLVDDGQAICCRYLFERSCEEMFEGAVLHARDFPAYFEALHAQRVIPAGNARTNPLTHELSEAYLEPLGVTSLLDAPIYQAGNVSGVICNESVGEVRAWTGAEHHLASSIADTVARLIEEAARQRAEASLAAYETHSTELRGYEALGKVASGVAHDFRTILRAVLGFSELILDSPDLPEAISDYARRIQATARSGERLTEELVAFGKDARNAPRILDAGEIISSLSAMLRVLLGAAIDLHIESAPSVSRVMIDRSKLERAVVNLLLNARDAISGPGEVRLAIHEEVVAESGGATYVVVAVTDNGAGMSQAVRERMFEPFFTTKGEHGTGLGLAIVAQVVSHAGGFTSIHSELGAGTTVKLYLPRIARHD